MAEINTTAVDKWSSVHALNGLGLGLMGLKPSLALTGAVVFEILEYAHEWPRGSTIFGSKGPETPANLVADMALYTGLFFVGRHLHADPAARLLGVGTLSVAALLAYTFAPKEKLESPEPWL